MIKYNQRIRHSLQSKNQPTKVLEYPCFDMISTGTCINDKQCCFIHDRRFFNLLYTDLHKFKKVMEYIANNKRSINSNFLQDDNMFIWPKLSSDKMETNYYDNNINYDIAKHDITINKYIISMWYHLIHVLNKDKNVNYFLENSLIKKNLYTNRPRLKCFIDLSNKKN